MTKQNRFPPGWDADRVQRVKARSPLCHWAVKELGMSTTLKDYLVPDRKPLFLSFRPKGEIF
jgi:hypothetical protein